MLRRHFVKQTAKWGSAAAGLTFFVGCGQKPVSASTLRDDDEMETVEMYDMHAMAMYFGGELGPRTGIVRVDYILTGTAVTLTFWHGHGGADHEFTLLPEHYSALKRGERVEVETTEVQGHSHKLFIDPSDPQWRVEGAQPVEVPVDLPEDPIDTNPDPEPDTPFDSDQDGIPDVSDLCSNTPPGSTVHTSGPWSGCAGGQIRD